MNASKHYYRNKENVDMAQYPYLLEGGCAICLTTHIEMTKQRTNLSLLHYR